jgi:hypothetical protein
MITLRQFFVGSHSSMNRTRPQKESVSLSRRCSCLDFLGGLSSGSVSVLLLSVDVLDVSASTSSGCVSSDVLDGPVISSLLGMETTTG